MKITAITVQIRNSDRVNISVDGTYRLSLDILQLTELGIKIGAEYTEDELSNIEQESVFGKLYARALEYVLMRPHSEKEVVDYLWRKSQPQRKKDGSLSPPLNPSLSARVLEKLKQKDYINDASFARYWVENRSLSKGISRRKLQLELRQKGVENSIIETVCHEGLRVEADELAKVIEKKRRRYVDERKFISYLMSQGFSYDAIKTALMDGQ